MWLRPASGVLAQLPPLGLKAMTSTAHRAVLVIAVLVITTTVTAPPNVKPSNHHLITTVKKGSHHLYCRHPRNCQRYVPRARHRPGDTIIALPEPRPSDSAVS